MREYSVQQMIHIAIAMSAEKDTTALLDRILTANGRGRKRLPRRCP